jgi:hypothetical protein
MLDANHRDSVTMMLLFRIAYAHIALASFRAFESLCTGKESFDIARCYRMNCEMLCIGR